MKTKPISRSVVGFTLIELTVVIVVLLAMMSAGMYYTNNMSKWKYGKDAGEKLRTVYAAQKSYLADNPTVVLSTLSEAEAATRILPYMPTAETSLPTAKTDAGASTLTIKANVSPPVTVNGNAAYDPSGSTSDGLWDVGL